MFLMKYFKLYYFLFCLLVLYTFFVSSFYLFEWDNKGYSVSYFFIPRRVYCIELETIERKFLNDYFYKKKSNLLVHQGRVFEILYFDKESKILGYKRNYFESTPQSLSLSFSQDKKYLRSTLFGFMKIAYS